MSEVPEVIPYGKVVIEHLIRELRNLQREVKDRGEYTAKKIEVLAGLIEPKNDTLSMDQKFNAIAFSLGLFVAKMSDFLCEYDNENPAEDEQTDAALDQINKLLIDVNNNRKHIVKLWRNNVCKTKAGETQ